MQATHDFTMPPILGGGARGESQQAIASDRTKKKPSHCVGGGLPPECEPLDTLSLSLLHFPFTFSSFSFFFYYSEDIILILFLLLLATSGGERQGL